MLIILFTFISIQYYLIILYILFHLNRVPLMCIKMWRSVNPVSIPINMVCNLKEAFSVDEEGWDSVTNLAAVVVGGSEGE